MFPDGSRITKRSEAEQLGFLFSIVDARFTVRFRVHTCQLVNVVSGMWMVPALTTWTSTARSSNQQCCMCVPIWKFNHSSTTGLSLLGIPP